MYVTVGIFVDQSLSKLSQDVSWECTEDPLITPNIYAMA